MDRRLTGSRPAHRPQRATRAPAAGRNRLRRALHGDRGSVSAELVIATPLLLLMVLAIVQFALWSHATHIVQTAASHGLAAARMQNATTVQGTTGAQHVLDQLGRGPLTNTRIDTRRSADAASIRVSGEASAVIPFLHLAVHAEAAGPVERFVPDLPATGR